jgi:AhpD family alkylhydroperoxidase
MYDKKDLGKLEEVEADVPEALKAFCAALDEAAMAAGVIPGKYKALMTLAVAFSTRCPHCIQSNAGTAREVGASAQEIAEVVAIASAARESAMPHGAQAIKRGGEFEITSLDIEGVESPVDAKEPSSIGAASISTGRCDEDARSPSSGAAA